MFLITFLAYLIGFTLQEVSESHYNSYDAEYEDHSHHENHSRDHEYVHTHEYAYYDPNHQTESNHMEYVPVENAYIKHHSYDDKNEVYGHIQAIHHPKESSYSSYGEKYHEHSSGKNYPEDLHINSERKSIYHHDDYNEAASWNTEKAHYTKHDDFDLPKNSHEACMKLHKMNYNEKHICCTKCDGFWGNPEIWSCKRRPHITDVVGIFHRVQLFSSNHDMQTIRVFAIHVQSTQATRAYLHNGFLQPVCDLTADSNSYPWHIVHKDLKNVFGHLASENSIMSACQKLAPFSSHYAKGFLWIGPQHKHNSSELGYPDAMRSHDYDHDYDIHKGKPGFFIHPYSIFAAYEGVQMHLVAPSVFSNKGVAFLGPPAPIDSCSGIFNHQTSIECSEPSLEVTGGTSIKAYKPIHIYRLEIVPNTSSECVIHIQGWIGYPKSFPGAGMSALMIHGGGLVYVEQGNHSLQFSFKRMEIEPDHWPPQEKYGVTYKLKTSHQDPNEVQALNISIDIFSSGYTGYGRATFRLLDGHFRFGHYDDNSWKVRGSSHVYLKGESITMEPELNDSIAYIDHEPNNSQHMGMLILSCAKICFLKDHLYYAKSHYPVDIWRFNRYSIN